MKPFILSRSRLASAIVCAVLLTACHGDARDLTEPVEASRLSLASLAIVPPEGTLTPLVINPTEQISFGLTASNTVGQTFAVASTNRRWVVSDASVATINENGLLTGLQDGTVQVRARLGEVWTPEFTVEVSFGVLSGVSILADTSNLQPCRAQTYTAVGSYTNPLTNAPPTQRSLADVEWTIDPEGSATLLDGDVPGSVLVSATTSGNLSLTATADGFFQQTALTVDNSLQSLSVADAIRIPQNETLQLTGFGNFATAMASEAVDITQSLSWSVASGEDNASVGNSASNKALLTGIATGPAQVQAACGDITAVTLVEVTDPITTLSAEDNDTEISLLAGGAGRQLNISTGSSYDEDNDVTNLATWGTVGAGSGDIVMVSNSGDMRGFVTPVAAGEATVRASYNNREIDFTITVR